MTPEEFRRDPYLRASGYDLWIWGAVNLLVALPSFAPPAGEPWPAGITIAWTGGWILCGIVLSATCHNRLRKMFPDVVDVPLVRADRIWGPLLVLGSLGMGFLLSRGQVAYVQPLWMLVVGTAYWQWGNFTLVEYRRLGRFLVAAGAASAWGISASGVTAREPSLLAASAWVAGMGLLWFPLGIYVNRRYLRPGDPAVAAGGTAPTGSR